MLMNHPVRLRALRRELAKRGVDALLVTHLPDVRWLCGFTGSNAALAVTGRKAVLFTDGRYTTQAKEETQGARVEIAKKSALKEACVLLEASAKGAAIRSGADYGRPAGRDALGARWEIAPVVFLAAEVADCFRRCGWSRMRRRCGRMEEAAALGCTLFDAILAALVVRHGGD